MAMDGHPGLARSRDSAAQWTPRACAEQGQRSAMVTPGLRGAGTAQRNGHPGLARSRDSAAQWSPRACAEQGLGSAMDAGPYWRGCSLHCPLCASHSRQSGLGLPPSRDDGPKSDRLLADAADARGWAMIGTAFILRGGGAVKLHLPTTSFWPILLLW